MALKMLMLFIITWLIISVSGNVTVKNNSFPQKYLDQYGEGVIFAKAFRDIALGLPTAHVTLLLDSYNGVQFPEVLIKNLHEAGVTTAVYSIRDKNYQEKFCEYTRGSLVKYEDSTIIILATRDIAVDLFWTIQQEDLIHRKLLYIFYWGHQTIETGFTTDHVEAMRIALITNPRPGTVYYSQGEASGNNVLTLVNWWSPETGLFRKPVLTSPHKVYQNFKGRMFEVPVLHKPPWNFVEYANDSFNVDGGRDDKLLTVIAEKLNFRYRYVDPPERIQGSSVTENGSFPGVLGQVWQRNYDFFMGDVTITYERSKSLEFSFFTLVDSEAFVTHRPSKLNEAFALIRPFHWKVWPLIIFTIALYGPALFMIIEAPGLWKKKKKTGKERRKLFWDCIWFSTATFLRQGGTQPGSSHKIRLVLTITTLGATYVIGDMYSANLTSLLARPGREKPISVLEELEAAMMTRGYELLVEKHSPSLSRLQNGTGIYKKIWDKMQTQSISVIESVEDGMKLVRENKNFALLGGRETLYFDSKRFGSYNFHMSEKLNTRYSAIAMQMGCPYIENFNRISQGEIVTNSFTMKKLIIILNNIRHEFLVNLSSELMQLFEGGILTKMTEEEYEKLGKKQRAAAGLGETGEQAQAQEELSIKGESVDTRAGMDKSEDEKIGLFGSDSELQPLNTRMLQGAFYVLVIGYFLSVLILAIEMNMRNIRSLLSCNRCLKCKSLINVCNCSKWGSVLLKCYVRAIVEPAKHIIRNIEDTDDEEKA